MRTCITALLEDSSNVAKYTLEQGRLQYNGKLAMSSKSLLPTILHTFHDSIMGVYFRFLRTYKRLIGELYWKGMKTDVKAYVEACTTCQ